MIGAHELGRVPLFGAAYDAAAVPACVEQHVHLAILVARDDHRQSADGANLVIAGMGYLAVVRDIDPGLLEDVAHLGVEDVRIAINLRAHAEIIRRRIDDAILVGASGPECRALHGGPPSFLPSFHRSTYPRYDATRSFAIIWANGVFAGSTRIARWCCS